VAAVRAALRAALKPYRKYSHGLDDPGRPWTTTGRPGLDDPAAVTGKGHGVRLRLMCDTVGSRDARHSRNASGAERDRAGMRGRVWLRCDAA